MELQRGTLIYYNPNSFISVYQGLLGSTPVAIKEQCYANLEAANSAVREAMIQAQLDHPHICRVHDCHLDQYQGWVRTVIVMEWMEGGDVWKEIERRSASGEHWTRDELERHMKTMVDALAYAQRRGISHRDIKPHNMYLTGDKNTIKLGDFGSSKHTLSPELSSTLHGTPAFLSPELRQQLVSVLMSGGGVAWHEESKADVYSLGITLVCMALLRYPQEELNAGEAALQRVVEQMDLSALAKAVIKQMLSEDVLKRPAFEELARLLNSPMPTVDMSRCAVCDLQLQQTLQVYSKTIWLSCGHPVHESCCYRYLEESFTNCRAFQAKCPQCMQILSLEELQVTAKWQQLRGRILKECVCCRISTLEGAQGQHCDHWLCLKCWSYSPNCRKCDDEDVERLIQANLS